MMCRPYKCVCGVCPTCVLYDTNAKYRKHFDAHPLYWGAEPKVAVVVRKFDCRLLGAATGETETCPSCRGTVRLKVFACEHEEHGPVTTNKKCGNCAGYEPRAVMEVSR